MQLPLEELAQLLLQSSTLSREALLARFQPQDAQEISILDGRTAISPGITPFRRVEEKLGLHLATGDRYHRSTMKL